MQSILRTFLSLVIPAAIAHDTTPVRRAATSLDNLQTALNGESNANVRYLAFAVKADEEGYGEVASLFRAAAKAEEIHARNHAEVLEKMGGCAFLELEPTKVKSTRENLKAAVEGEVYERDVMYPEFIEAARQRKETLAIRTFTWAMKVEALHALLYQDALQNLEKRRGASHTYYVCPDCGNTLEELTILKCLICGHPKSGFIAVA
jgi:rubrerythrin